MSHNCFPRQELVDWIQFKGLEVVAFIVGDNTTVSVLMDSDYGYTIEWLLRNGETIGCVTRYALQNV